MEAQKEKKKKKGKRSVMSILGGKFLVREEISKQLPFLVYVTALLMVIITNTYIAEERTRERRTEKRPDARRKACRHQYASRSTVKAKRRREKGSACRTDQRHRSLVSRRSSACNRKYGCD